MREGSCTEATVIHLTPTGLTVLFIKTETLTSKSLFLFIVSQNLDFQVDTFYNPFSVYYFSYFPLYRSIYV